MLVRDMYGDYEETDTEVEYKLSKSGKRTLWVKCYDETAKQGGRKHAQHLANNETIKLLVCSLPESVLRRMFFWWPQSPAKINIMLFVKCSFILPVIHLILPN